MDFYAFETAFGAMALAGEGDKLTRLWLPGCLLPRLDSEQTPLLAEGRRQLEEYLAGGRQVFQLPLNPKGTDFQRQVWDALLTIPFGQTRTYGQIAAQVGRPKGSRAVGMANHQNPLPIFIPCHRVVGVKGLTGYAGGLELKERLLALEQTQ